MRTPTMKLLAILLMSTACLAATGCHLMPGRMQSSCDSCPAGGCNDRSCHGGFCSGGACSAGGGF